MDKTINYLKQILEDNKKVVLACSGGPDSMCLFHILNDLKKEINFTLIIAHMNHKQRIESEEERVFVENITKDNNLIFEYYELNEEIKTNFHSIARQIRYKFLNEVIDKYQADYLMTAHHGDDLMETILMRLARGSTLKGYSGFDLITNKDTYQVVHPLIFYTKEQIKKYMDDNNYEYRIDKTNNSQEYTRNRYRHNILPLLKKENENIHEKYYKFSNSINEVDEYINKVVNNIIKNIYVNKVLDINRFKKEDKYIQKRIIEYILDSIYPDNLYLVSDSNTKNIINMIYNKKPNILLKLPNNNLIIKEYNKLFINKNINIIKESIEFNNYYENDNIIIESINNNEDKSNYIIRLDSKEIKLPLILRNRNVGDKMIIKNMNNEKKVKDILIDSKIPTTKRDQLLLLTDSNNQILWLPGIKKSKFDKDISQNCDIILKCIYKGEEKK